MAADIVNHPSSPRLPNVPCGTRVFIYCPHCTTYCAVGTTDGAAVRALAAHIVACHRPLVDQALTENGAA